MRRTGWLGALFLSSTILAIVACQGGPGALPGGDPQGRESPGPSTSTEPSGSGGGSDGTGSSNEPGTSEPATPRPPSGPLGAASAVSRIQFVEQPFGAIGCVHTETLLVDLSAKSMTVSTCKASVDDGGTSSKTVTLTDDDVKALRDLVDALKADTAAADAGCSGHDGTNRDLRLTSSGRAVSVHYEYNCSGPKPDVRVERDGFLALRKKLYGLAGLDPTMRPY